MFEEPWFTFILIALTPVLLIGGASIQDWMSFRAARRRARDAAQHSAE